MSDILSFLPQPTPISICGKVYNILPFSLNEMAKIQKWIDTVSPNPLAFIVEQLGTLAPDARRAVLNEMKQYKTPKLGTEEASDLLGTFDGLKEIFKIAIQKADPSVDNAKIDELIGSMSIEQFSKLMQKIGGIAFESEDDPKEKAAE